MLFAAAILTLTPGMFFSGVFTDHVVLQRAPARAAVYGGGCSSGTVSVTVTKGIVLVETVNASAASRAGEWKALLTAQPAGGAFTIKATCGNASASLHDVTFGDVWLCTGQSNMELNMGFTFEQNETYVNISKGALATIRIFHLDHFASPYDAPIDVFNNTDLNLANWTTLDSASLSTLTLGKDANVVNTFSAACLYFATSLTYRMQQQQVEAGGGAVVPLGMIESAWGGTAIEQWLSPAAQLTCGNVTCLANHSVPYSAATAEMCANDDNGGKQAELGNGGLWNGMTRPFVNMTVKGYLWYQGENNLFADAGTTANGGTGYACLLQKQMESWRSAWSVTPGTTSSTAPFGIVQLADGTDEGWGCNTLQMHWAETGNYGVVPNVAFPNAFVAAAHDLGEPWDDGCKTSAPYCCVAAVAKSGPTAGKRDPACGAGDPRGMQQKWLINHNPKNEDWVMTSEPTTPQLMGGIHPSIKRPVGERLATAAWSLVYGHPEVAYTGPVVSGCSVSADKNTMTIRFNKTLLGSGSLVIGSYDKADKASAVFVKVGSPFPGNAASNFLYANRAPWWGDDSSWMHVDILGAGKGPNEVLLDLSPLKGKGVITGVKYGSGTAGTVPQSGHKRVCCGTRDITKTPCKPNGCPLSSSEGLPAMPFHARVDATSGVCACIAPQVCNEPIV